MRMFRVLGTLFGRRSSALAVVSLASCSHANLKQLELKQDPAQFTHKYLLQQAATVVSTATSQLLTQSVVAIVETVGNYRTTILELIQLLNTREHFTEGDLADEISGLITGARSKANDLKSQLLELQSFMEYVEKLVVSSAETSFLSGAEYCSTSLSEQLISAQLQIKDSLKNLQDLEDDLIVLQKRIISNTK